MRGRTGIFAFVLLPPEGGSFASGQEKPSVEGKVLSGNGGFGFFFCLWGKKTDHLPKRGSVLRPFLGILLRILLGRYYELAG